MNKIYSLLFVLAISLSSCGTSDIEKVYKNLGKSNNYDNFLWSKGNWDEDLLLPQTLQLTVGKLKFTKPIELQVVYSEKLQSTYKPVNTSEEKILTVFKNDEPIEGSCFKIYPKDSVVNLKFRFNEDVKNKGTSANYQISLKIIDHGDLDMINGMEAENGTILDTSVKWQGKYEKVWHPLQILLLWICIIIISLLVIWFIILRRLIFPTFAFDNLQVTYFEGESRKGREDCTLHGARKIICSKSPKYQSGLNKLFCGRIEYLTNQFWETTVVMTPCGSDGISVNEDMKAGDASTYRMTAMITAQNGPRRPFVVKRTKSEQVANISIG